jgi:diguanylate cyclase (GGDEF)-like protein
MASPDEGKSRELLVAEIAQLKEQVADLKAGRNLDRTLDAAYFRMRSEDEVARSTRYKYEFSILLTGMDNLEPYAKKYGKDSTGELVTMLGTVMRDTFRKTDIYCQFEPGKYGVILPHTNIEGALIVAEKLRQRVERVFTFKSDSAKIKLTMSIGAVSYPADANSEEQLWQAASNILSKAKAEGGNCIWSETTSNKYSVEKNSLQISSQNAMLFQAINDEALRCSRFGHKFSLILVSLSGPTIEKSKTDNQLRTKIIQGTSRLINITVRNVDKSYFYMQNKFAVLLPNTDSQNARIVAEKLMNKLSESQIIKYAGGADGIAVHIGLASFPSDDLSKEGLIRRAETALEYSIRAGNKKIVQASSFLDRIEESESGLNVLVSAIKEAGTDAIYNLLLIVDLIENYSPAHSLAVAKYALEIGKAMSLSDSANWQLRLAALMHDVGKIRVPKEIITKPGHLSPKELGLMRMHPLHGAALLRILPGFLNSSKAILSHHERWDGNGYPQGLKGNQIPLESQIIAVAEAFDDMVTPRPYRTNMSRQEASSELKKNSGTQFNPFVINTFAKIIDKLA